MELKDDIRFINKFLYSIQKHRIALDAWIKAKDRDGIQVSKNVHKLFNDMEDQEKAAKKMAKEIVVLSPVWDEFFERVLGIGECLSTSLMAEIGDISKFPTVTSLWAYCAMIGGYVKAKCSNKHHMIMSGGRHKTCPVFNNQEGEPCGGDVTITETIEGHAPKREKGYHYLFNSRLQMICWKVSEQMVKQGNVYYRSIYDTSKTKYINKALGEGLKIIPAKILKIKPKKEQVKYISEGHIHNKAKRAMVKMVLSNLWEAWRGCEGLEIKPPYVIAKLGHTGYIPWTEVRSILDREKEIKKKRKKKVA